MLAGGLKAASGGGGEGGSRGGLILPCESLDQRLIWSFCTSNMADKLGRQVKEQNRFN